MRANVCHASGRPGLFRVRPPGRLLLAFHLDRPVQPALRILRHHLPDFAQLPFPDHRPGLLYHRVASVVMGQGKDSAGLPNDLAQGQRFGEIDPQRFIANDVETGFEERLANRDVHPVGSDDRDEVDPFPGRQLRFCHRHRLVVGINARRIDQQFFPRKNRLFRAGGKSARDQIDLAVESHCHAMHAADEGVGSTTDHSSFQSSFHAGTVFGG